MKIEVVFRGLFLFAPRTNVGEMRVIVPETMGIRNGQHHDGGTHARHHQHVPVLRYHRKYVDADDAPTFRTKEFAGYNVEFPALTGRLYPELEDIADVSRVMSETMKRTLSESAASSIFRFSAGWLTTQRGGYKWQWLSNKKAGLATTVRWHCSTSAKELTLNLVPRDDTGTADSLTLKPPGTSDRVVLEVWHVPVADVSQIGAPEEKEHPINTPAKHFELHYGMFTGVGTGNFAVPIYKGKAKRAVRKTRKGSAKHARTPRAPGGVDPINCLPGGCPDCCPDC